MAFNDFDPDTTGSPRLQADAAARRAYAAGSRDGAREMRLKAARLVAVKGCLCYEVLGDVAAEKLHHEGAHFDGCPAALAEAIRRLPDGREGE